MAMHSFLTCFLLLVLQLAIALAQIIPLPPFNPFNIPPPPNPLNPLDPSSPSNPLNPQNPLNPLNPSNPVNPLNPLNPSNPLNPLSICNTAQCGRGQCIPSSSSRLGYICQCEAGWAQALVPDLNNNFQFRPCTIPQCQLNLGGCQLPQFPEPKPLPSNLTLFDPCNWAYCGGGTCTRNSTLSYVCTCNSGFSNILNIPLSPCFNQCSLGPNCSSFGIQIAKSQRGNASATSDISANHGSSIMPAKLKLTIILVMSMLMVLSK